MIAFPAATALVSAICMAVIGGDAVRRPRPDRIAWTIAFAIFAIAAGAEVAGSTFGWTAPLARIYYLSGAVLVVGFLALGELYLLLGARMPPITPGVALLVSTVSATVVWSAPIGSARLEFEGWAAIERGPALIALAAFINAAGTAILVSGALYSAWRMRESPSLRQRAVGCMLIAVGTIVVATGGTLTRFGQREFLYLAMTIGISIISLGVLLTRSRGMAVTVATAEPTEAAGALSRPQLTALPTGYFQATSQRPIDEAARFVAEVLLPLGENNLAQTCVHWGATPLGGEPLSREQAARVWELRLALPADDRNRLDRLSLPIQAQLGELYAEVWSDAAIDRRNERRA